MTASELERSKIILICVFKRNHQEQTDVNKKAIVETCTYTNIYTKRTVSVPDERVRRQSA